MQGQLARPYHAHGSTARSSPGAAGKKDLPEADIKIISRVEELAQKKGWKMSHIALAWSRQKGIASPIVGFSKLERIDEALEMKGKELTDEDMKYLEELYVPKNVAGHS